MLSNDKLSTRDRSVGAALEVVRSDGIEELTTRAIARQSGLTQPAIYRHFAGKEELVRAVLGEIRAAFYERLVEASSGGDAEARLRAALGTFCGYAADEPRLYDALFLQTAAGSVSPPAVDPSRGGNVFGYLVERVSEVTREGGLRSEAPVATALTLAGHAQGLVLLYRQGRFGSAERFSDFFHRSMDDLLRGLAP